MNGLRAAKNKKGTGINQVMLIILALLVLIIIIILALALKDRISASSVNSLLDKANEIIP